MIKILNICLTLQEVTKIYYIILSFSVDFNLSKPNLSANNHNVQIFFVCNFFNALFCRFVLLLLINRLSKLHLSSFQISFHLQFSFSCPASVFFPQSWLTFDIFLIHRENNRHANSSMRSWWISLIRRFKLANRSNICKIASKFVFKIGFYLTKLMLNRILSAIKNWQKVCKNLMK